MPNSWAVIQFLKAVSRKLLLMTILPNHSSGLRSNIVAMGIVQIGNYVIPLITLPYLTRTLGVEAYGKVAFAQAFMSYFVLLVDYGFAWSATRKIAAHRADRALISHTFVATWMAQWLLVVVALALSMLIVLSAARLRPDAWLYVATFSSVLGGALFPFWFLQGLERLQVAAFLQLLTRIVVLLPIFLLVRQPADAIWVPIINGSGITLGGLLALLWIRRQRLVQWCWPGWQSIFSELRDSGALFSSRVAISFYTTLVPLVLGWVAGPVAFAHFNLADKLRTAAQALLTPVSQALFPRMSHLVATDGNAAFQLVKRSAAVILALAGSASMTLWILAEWLVVLLGGEEFRDAAAVLRWFAPLPLVIGLSNLFGIQIMLPNRMNRSFNGILIVAAIVSLILIWPMVSANLATGAAQTMLLVELSVTASMSILLWRRGYLSPRQWRSN